MREETLTATFNALEVIREKKGFPETKVLPGKNYYKYKSGGYVPSFQTICRIAEALGVGVRIEIITKK